MPPLTLPTRYLDVFMGNTVVKENVFLNRPADPSVPPTFHAAKDRLPQPFWDGHDAEIACYWKVWELAFRNLRQPTAQNGFITPYIDTAFNDCLFLWDSVFILMFARYGSRAFHFQQTLDNLYHSQATDGFITRELQQWDGQIRFHRCDPVSTGPNVLAWSEWEYFLNTNDKRRLAEVFPVLLGFHRWMRAFRTWQDGSYWSCGLACGMDNQPRTPPGCDWYVEHGHMTWIDATAQAALDARLLLQMADVIGRAADVADLREELPRLTACINERLWDAGRNFYCDRLRDGTLSTVPSVAAFWTLLAGVVPADRLDPFLAHLEDPAEFNRPHRVPSLGATHPLYEANGGYWKGGVWPPTNYMILRGLTEYGRDALAFEIAANHVRRVTETFEATGTVWEKYAPETAAPGDPAKGDFVGWGGVGPVAVLFEYLFGLRPDVPAARLVLDVRLTDRFGVKNYPFGANGGLDLTVAARRSEADEPVVQVRSDVPLTIALRWAGGNREFAVAPATPTAAG